MRIKTVALLAVAVGCGLFAMLGVRQAMNGKPSGDQEEKVSVLVAVTEIPVGTQLTPENVMFKDVAVSLVPEDAILSEEEYAERSANFPIQPHDFVSLSKLTEPGVTGKSVQIEKGMRVVSVKVNATQTHSNMLAAGDRVDVLVTYSSRAQRGMTTKTKTLLEYIEIFAAGDRTVNDGNQDSEDQVKNISLLVTPEQANYVYLAERKGELSLVWRNVADDEQVQVATIDERLMEELSGTVNKDGRHGRRSPYDNDPEDAEPQQTVSNWLNEQQPVTPEPQPEPQPEPPPIEVALAEPEQEPVPTWKLVIFAGEEEQTVEFELPREQLPAEGVGTTSHEETGTASLEDGGTAGGTEPVSAPSDVANPFGALLEQFQKLPFAK